MEGLRESVDDWAQYFFREPKIALTWTYYAKGLVGRLHLRSKRLPT